MTDQFDPDAYPYLPRRTPAGIEPPWTDREVVNLNDFQTSSGFHPFTCPDRGDGKHRDVDPEGKLLLNLGVLVATPDGWRCPDCGYTQDWAHPSMVKGEWRDWPRPF